MERQILLWHKKTIEELKEIRDSEKLSEEEMKNLSGTISLLEKRTNMFKGS